MALLYSISILVSLGSALILPDGVGKLPALGWNSWNTFECDINETVVLQTAKAMVDKGFKSAGYTYVNLDDCWADITGRDNVTNQLVPDAVKFPNGMKYVADQVHELGLKLGIYSSAGTLTCADYPASIGFESLDAATFAAWGVDYLKYDNCNVPRNWTDTCNACTYRIARPQAYLNGTCIDTTGLCAAGYDYSTSNTAKRYSIMRDALLTQNRTILYSMCNWGAADVEDWGAPVGSSWRTTNDIRPSWNYVMFILNINSFLMNAVDFWGHNDLDMLEVGNAGLSLAEQRTHFAFWAATKSPLIMGCDLTKVSDESRDIMLNKPLLDFNQDDVYGKPAKPYKWGTNADWTFNASHPAECWSGKSKQGVLVLLLNNNGATRNLTVDFGEVPELNPNKSYTVTDAWTGKRERGGRGFYSVSVGPRDTAALLFKPEHGWN